jgi:hypothetical protein
MLRSGRTVAEICGASELSDEALTLLADRQVPKEYVELLMEQELYPDAVRFLAHALPKREAVWWAWVCARRAAGEEPPDDIQAVLEATRQWIAEPTDGHRRAAMELAEQVGFDKPAGSAALAAFFSGESLAPADVEQPVPPGEYMAAKAITGCILLATVGTEPERAGEKFQDFVQQGMEVAEKIELWKPPEESRG